MTTPLDIILLSMKDAGYLGSGETPSAEDVNDVFQKLNWMIDQWSRQRLMVYHLVEKVCTSNGTAAYTVGPGGDFDIAARPPQIHSAVWRQTPSGGTPVDYPLDVLQAYEDYQRIVAKQATGAPQAIFMDTGWPSGTIYTWPVAPAGQYEIRVLFNMLLSRFTSLTETINLPPAYESAINWNLAKAILPMVGEGAPNAIVLAEAAASKALIRRENSQPRRLRMPFGIPRRQSYNGYSGTYS